jgi:pectin methylesterase-like acyl-CoA thioesterase
VTPTMRTMRRMTPPRIATALGLLALLAPVSIAAAPAASAATVTLTVATSGGEYSSIQAAVNAVPNNSSTSYVISVGKGTYDEYVTIPAGKLHLSLVGATGSPGDVLIDGAHYAGEAYDSAGDTYGTLGSATVHVAASNFTAEYITFRNTFNKNSHPSVTGTQAVALAMEGDRQVYKDCVFFGHQDTLLSWTGSPATDIRQYVYGGAIEGDVDFIFGDGTLVVDRSLINVLNDGVYSSGYLAAPATYQGDRYGILITGSTVTSGLAAGTVGLGRAWDAYSGAEPQEIIRGTSLPAAIDTSSPWSGISGASWASGRYGEYGNTGSGATVNPNRPQLTSSEAAGYTAQKYLAGSDGWNPVVG